VLRLVFWSVVPSHHPPSRHRAVDFMKIDPNFGSVNAFYDACDDLLDLLVLQRFYQRLD
jgi:hypothetical protein